MLEDEQRRSLALVVVAQPQLDLLGEHSLQAVGHPLLLQLALKVLVGVVLDVAGEKLLVVHSQFNKPSDQRRTPKNSLCCTERDLTSARARWCSLNCRSRWASLRGQDQLRGRARGNTLGGWTR